MRSALEEWTEDSESGWMTEAEEAGGMGEVACWKTRRCPERTCQRRGWPVTEQRAGHSFLERRCFWRWRDHAAAFGSSWSWSWSSAAVLVPEWLI